MNVLKSLSVSKLLLSALGVLVIVPLLADTSFSIPVVEDGGADNVSDQAHHSGSAYGKVGYSYNIGMKPVANELHPISLNSVAETNSTELYRSNMAGAYDDISRSGTSGSYIYAVAEGKASDPVDYVLFFDATRFSNGLANRTMSNTSVGRGIYAITSDGLFVPNEGAWNAGGYATFICIAILGVTLVCRRGRLGWQP